MEYAWNGALVHNEFEDAQPAYVVFFSQPGSSQTPSATFQLQEHLPNYIRDAAANATDEESPAQPSGMEECNGVSEFMLCHAVGPVCSVFAQSFGCIHLVCFISE